MQVLDEQRAKAEEGQEAEHIGQDRCRLLSAAEKQGDALEAADCMFGGNVLAVGTLPESSSGKPDAHGGSSAIASRPPNQRD